jgi:ribosome modulation factor
MKKTRDDFSQQYAYEAYVVGYQAGLAGKEMSSPYLNPQRFRFRLGAEYKKKMLRQDINWEFGWLEAKDELAKSQPAQVEIETLPDSLPGNRSILRTKLCSLRRMINFLF